MEMKELIELYNEKSNKIQRLLSDYKNIPILIYGNGVLSNCLEEWLKENGITIEGHIVNKDYKQTDDEITIEDVVGIYSQFVVILGVALPQLVEYYTKLFASFEQVQDILYFGDNYPSGEAFLKPFWIEKHERDLQVVFECLEDEVSKKTMMNFLKAKVSGNAKHLNEGNVLKYSGEEYFNEIFPSFGQEIFVDGGAYDGDTYKQFLLSGIDYKKYYAFEPDYKNIEKLKTTVKNDEKTYVCECGLYEKETDLYFSLSGSMSSKIANELNGVKIPVINIDLAAPDATFIKMDIEGAEYAALRGARRTIITNRPKLAICCYHTIDDIWQIPLYIKKICPEYKLFYRLYQKDWCRDLILYGYVEE